MPHAAKAMRDTPRSLARRGVKRINNGNVAGSFRDPSGFLFTQNGTLYRQVNKVYQENYDQFIKSGLYKELVAQELLTPYKEVGLKYAQTKDVYKVIKPEPVPFISYPYEWSFSQLKDAALTTLKIQKIALEYEMSLKDASAYNIQFVKGGPILIDTLSFEEYQEGKPWVAYRQFCQHFLAPLALMSHTDVQLNQLLRVYIDGIPLDLASTLLPSRTKLRPSLFMHIHLHAKSQKYFADKPDKTGVGRDLKVGRTGFLNLINSLESAVKGLRWNPKGTEWADYYSITNYSKNALAQKRKLVNGFIRTTKPKSVWDLGANIGTFSRLASNRGIQTIAFDIDPAAVEKNYREVVKNGETNLLPLILDLTNPSPATGWENKERMSLLERGPADAVLALALIHHLAISNNLPLSMIAKFFHKICHSLIIEFVPKSDSQVQKLLASREDIFPDYTQESFEVKFGKHFKIKSQEKIRGSERVLYLMAKI